MGKLPLVIFASLLASGLSFGQKAKPSPTPTPERLTIIGSSDTAAIATIHTSGDFLEDGIFKSRFGKFSIAIPQLPKHTIDNATEKAKAKRVDVGKQFVWIFEKTLYTLYYSTPFDKNGNPSPHVYADLENGTRKGVINGGAKLLSEKPIKLGKHRGTEFRYVIPNGVRYINRIYSVGDRGYQIVGGYADEKDEQKIIDVLNSFKLLKNK